MKNCKLKKALAVIISAAMMTSVMSVGSISVGATENTKNYYVPSAGTETNTVYFYMPDDWYNEYGKTAGAYWWEGTDACPSWEEMYAMTPTETEDIYSIEIPVDVKKVIFNNYFDGGSDSSDPKYSSSKQTTDIRVGSEEDGYDSWVYFPEENGVPADSDLYTEGLASVDGMIFVIDEGLTSVSPFYGRIPAEGEWYYYYGNGEYGFFPEKSETFFTNEYNDVFAAVDLKYNLIIEPTTEDGTSNCVIEPTEEPFSTIVEPSTEDSTSNCVIEPTEEPFSTIVEPSTEDSTSNCVIEPTEEPSSSIVEPSTEDSTSNCVIEPPTFFPENTNKIYFDVESSGWTNYRTIYCHIWRADGTGVWPDWQTRKESCIKEEDGRYSYDTTKTGNIISRTDGKDYCVIFSSDTGAMTYQMVMSGSCLGDTAYVTGYSFESPDDSEKKVTVAAWRYNPDCGPQRMITATGTIIGTAFPDGESDETMLRDYLIKNYNDKTRLAKTQDLLNELNISPQAAGKLVSKKLNTSAEEGEITWDEAIEIYDAIVEVLVLCDDTDNTIPSIPDETTPSTPEDDIASDDAKIYFDVESAGWKNYKSIYCHIWSLDGTGEWPSWQTKRERCDLEDDGRYSYTLSKTGNEFRYSDGRIYGVIFSADTGAQTYNVVMNGACIGDTVYVTDERFEAPEDSEKKVLVAEWRNNTDCGSQRRITSTGNVIGRAHVEGETDETLLADFLIKYHDDRKKLDLVSNLVNEMSVKPEDVLNEVMIKHSNAVNEGLKTEEQVAYEYGIIEYVLNGVDINVDIPHDINGDEYTDVNDVTTLQMSLAGYVVDVQESKVDVNGDGFVDVKDVTALQLYLVA